MIWLVKQPVHNREIEVEVGRGILELVEGVLRLELLATVIREPGFQIVWL